MSDALKQAQQALEMDMTPMIDCVFLLMIFFVLVIDLSQQNLEDLILPKATFQEPDDQPPDNRPVINLLQDGSIYYKGKRQYGPNDPDYSGITNMLKLIRTQGGVKTKDETLPNGQQVTLVDDPILLRADKWTEWHYVGEVMKQCSNPQFGFWKIELAMSEKDKEEKLLAK